VTGYELDDCDSIPDQGICCFTTASGYLSNGCRS